MFPGLFQDYIDGYINFFRLSPRIISWTVGSPQGESHSDYSKSVVITAGPH